MKNVMVNLTLACFSFMLVSLMFTNIGTAELDLKTAAGIWLFDEGKGNTAADASENGNDGKT